MPKVIFLLVVIQIYSCKSSSDFSSKTKTSEAKTAIQHSLGNLRVTNDKNTESENCLPTKETIKQGGSGPVFNFNVLSENTEINIVIPRVCGHVGKAYADIFARATIERYLGDEQLEKVVGKNIKISTSPDSFFSGTKLSVGSYSLSFSVDYDALNEAQQYGESENTAEDGLMTPYAGDYLILSGVQINASKPIALD